MIVLLALILSSFQTDQTFGCALYLKSTFYELKSLASTSPYNVSLNPSETLIFNVCDNLKTTCDSKSGLYSYGRIMSNNSILPNCTDIAYSYDKYSFLAMNDANNNTFIRLDYENYSLPCNEIINQNRNYSFIIDFFCDESLKDAPIIATTRNPCQIKVDFRYAYACPKLEIGAIWVFFSSHNILFFLVLVGSGILCSLFGYKLFKPTLFVLGFLSASFGFIILFYEFVMSPSSPQWVVYIVFGIAVFVGIIAGYILYVYNRYGIFLLGSLLGYIIIMMLWTLFVHSIFNDSLAALYILTTLSVIGGSFLSYWLHEHIIVISTSYVGAYIIFKGIGLILGGFPNEFTLYEQIKNGKISSFSISAVVYIFFIIIYGTLSMIYQENKMTNNENQDEENRKAMTEELITRYHGN